MLFAPLSEADPEIHALVEREKERQFHGLELIASEVQSCRLLIILTAWLIELYFGGCDGG